MQNTKSLSATIHQLILACMSLPHSILRILFSSTHKYNIFLTTASFFQLPLTLFVLSGPLLYLGVIIVTSLPDKFCLSKATFPSHLCLCLIVYIMGGPIDRLNTDTDINPMLFSNFSLSHIFFWELIIVRWSPRTYAETADILHIVLLLWHMGLR